MATQWGGLGAYHCLLLYAVPVSCFVLSLCFGLLVACTMCVRVQDRCRRPVLFGAM